MFLRGHDLRGLTYLVKTSDNNKDNFRTIKILVLFRILMNNEFESLKLKIC